MRKRIFFVVLSLFFFGAGFAVGGVAVETENAPVAVESAESPVAVEVAVVPEVLEPEKKEFSDNVKSSIRITASKRKSSVFINDEYFGTTPLTIEDLTPATYVLKVEKGESSRSVLIEVKRGMKLDFFVEL